MFIIDVTIITVVIILTYTSSISYPGFALYIIEIEIKYDIISINILQFQNGYARHNS